MHGVFDQAIAKPKRIIFPEGEAVKIVRAAKILADEGICRPVLLGSAATIGRLLADHEIPENAVDVVDPTTDSERETYAEILTRVRWRNGVTLDNARKLMRDPVYFGNMMLHQKTADGLIAGLTMSYPETIRPALQIHRTRDGIHRAAGIYLLLFEDRMLFIADTTVNQDPDAGELAEIAFLASQVAKNYFHVTPRVAMLSYSNFGSNIDHRSKKVRDAVAIAEQRWPDLVIEGEMQADTAVEPGIARETYPLSRIQGDANILVCPDLESANIAYKLLWRLGKVEAIGPILTGINAPVHVLQRGVDVNDIVNMAALCVLKAQRWE
jgi:malate dehydrogenase (oxaloacetate-decarboxylating)(NADP+)